MSDIGIIPRIAAIVNLMRTSGTFIAVLDSGEIYTITSNVVTMLSVGNYVTLEGNDYRVTEIVSAKIFKITTNGEAAPAASGAWAAKAPYFMFGTRKSINRDLIERNGGEYAYQKYPLIALRLPVRVNVVKGISQMDDVNLLFASFTSQQYKMQERYDNVIEPVLRPLVDLFLYTLKNTGYFSILNADYTYIDRPFYGTDEGGQENIANVFDDPLDAIEVRGLKLKFIATECPPLN